MGVNTLCAKWFYYAKLKYGVDYSKLAVLGRQYFSYDSFYKMKRHLGSFFDINDIRQEDGYSEKLWKALGGESSSLDVFDYSDYEGANQIYDMNKPISKNFYGRYSTVVDGGTLEHVFDYPQAIRNIMKMVMPGGHLILMTPANQYLGHGFYQFSPELYYSLLTPQNGFSIEELCLYEEEKPYKRSLRKTWDNASQGIRVQMKSKSRITLFVLAKKIGEVPDEFVLQQSDYVKIWENNIEGEKGDQEEQKRSLQWLRDYVKNNCPRITKKYFEYAERLYSIRVEREKRKKLKYFDIDKEIRSLVR